MTNFFKGFAFLVFGVLCSPIMLGLVSAMNGFKFNIVKWR